MEGSVTIEACYCSSYKCSVESFAPLARLGGFKEL
jgi:hypothetical protein